MKNIICLLLMIMVTLTGCISLSEVDEDKVKGISDAITNTIINTVGREKSEKQASHTLKSKDLNSLKLKNTVGDISILSHESQDTIVNINITAKAGSKTKAEDLIENYTYKVSSEGRSIIVDTSYEENIKDAALMIDLTIYLPDTIDNIEVSTNVGDAYLSGVSGNIQIINNVSEITIDKSEGSYILNVDVGAITLKNCLAVGNSEFKTNTGEIEISLSDISKAVSIIAETGVGDIEMSLSDDSGYHATINEFMKDERIQTKNDQGTNINLTTGVGKIDFN